jgi:hypothetical protein
MDEVFVENTAPGATGGTLNLPQAAHPCPTCGCCPTCGRRGYGVMPYYPYSPYHPYWISPVWCGSTGTSATGQVVFTGDSLSSP